MKNHVMIAAGLTLFVTFAYRFALAVSQTGLGWNEVYLAGGLLLAGFVIRNGLAGWKDARKPDDEVE